MHDTLTYDLEFVSPQRRPRTFPEIVFIVDQRHLPEIVDRLHFINTRYREYIDAYLGESEHTFALPIPDLFRNKEFGFGKCGYWTVENGKIHFRLQLRPFPWTHLCSLTIFVLTKALGSPFDNEPPSNEKQGVSLMTLSEIGRSCGYGHAGGWISEDVLRWLSTYAKANIQPIGIISNAAPMHPDVIKAMQAAAGAMITSRKYGYRASGSQIYGWIRDSGAFNLNCYGDACDLGVYPDSWLSEGCETVEFGCHNLDNADQQLTLLSGVAKIAQLARNDCS